MLKNVGYHKGYSTGIFVAPTINRPGKGRHAHGAPPGPRSSNGPAMWGRDITAQALVIIEAVLAAMDGRIKLLARRSHGLLTGVLFIPPLRMLPHPPFIPPRSSLFCGGTRWLHEREYDRDALRRGRAPLELGVRGGGVLQWQHSKAIAGPPFCSTFQDRRGAEATTPARS
ncbi:hypothetical protein B0H14DRAFT_3439385 [Mycena olivaceomarginata]|nr:hypothetical protein B0H14DRAFT_3439385 [Mycena olivaceomarginata]